MIQPPKWCANAVPTARGWTHPSTGELYVARRFSEEEIAEFFGKVEEAVENMYGVDHSYTAVNEQIVHEAPQMLHEAPVSNVSLDGMTKVQLQALCEERGIEYTPRETKAVLVEKLS